LNEAVALAWKPSSVEADVYIWRYALLEVQPEKKKKKLSTILFHVSYDKSILA